VENSFDATTINRQVEGLAASHQLLLGRLGGLTDDMVARPSLLPEWTVGHVLAHIAHQGDSISRLFRAAELGEMVDQYEGGFAARVAAIERDASLSADEHVTGVRRSIYALEGAIASAREGWYGSARMVSGIEVPVTDLPLRRWREVEVHMGDLGLAELQCVGPDSWSLDYVRHDLSVMTMQWKSRGSMGLTDLPSQIRTQSPTVRLGWLMGRATIDGLAPAGLMG
jgi:maleylpyruvate isomerase